VRYDAPKKAASEGGSENDSRERVRKVGAGAEVRDLDNSICGVESCNPVLDMWGVNGWCGLDINQQHAT